MTILPKHQSVDGIGIGVPAHASESAEPVSTGAPDPHAQGTRRPKTDYAAWLLHHARYPDPVSLHCAIPAFAVEAAGHAFHAQKAEIDLLRAAFDASGVAHRRVEELEQVLRDCLESMTGVGDCRTHEARGMIRRVLAGTFDRSDWERKKSAGEWCVACDDHMPGDHPQHTDASVP